jgi:hypothetical protein
MQLIKNQKRHEKCGFVNEGNFKQKEILVLIGYRRTFLKSSKQSKNDDN